MITISVNVLKLDRARFKEVTLKDGSKAKFCDLVLWETPDDKYGNDYVVKQSTTKEERAAKLKMPVLGNGKAFGPAKESAPSPEANDGGSIGEVPF